MLILKMAAQQSAVMLATMPAANSAVVHSRFVNLVPMRLAARSRNGETKRTQFCQNGRPGQSPQTENRRNEPNSGFAEKPRFDEKPLMKNPPDEKPRR